MNKEHVYPKWLLERTKTKRVNMNSPYGKIIGDKLTIPLCEECNTLLGLELEVPVSRIFTNIESGSGFNDFDAELLIRWLWKIQGMFYWSICNDQWEYSVTTLKDRVLSPIQPLRSRLSIGIALIEDEFEDMGYSPIGLDAFTLWSNVYAVGVFSKISIVVFYASATKYVNDSIWTTYTLSDCPMMMNPQKKTYPSFTFKTATEAVKITTALLGQDTPIMQYHEELSLKLRRSARFVNPQ